MADQPQRAAVGPVQIVFKNSKPRRPASSVKNRVTESKNSNRSSCAGKVARVGKGPMRVSISGASFAN